MKVNGRMTRAHRWAYEHFVGPIPSGKQIDHICGVTRCVNPDHLRIATPSENTRAYWRELRTHCRAGHEYTADNVLWYANGKRRCRECRRLNSARNNEYQRRGRIAS